MSKNDKPIEYNAKDFEFMNSLSSAILEQSPSKIGKVLKIWLFTLFIFVLWGSFSNIDEITRGSGKVIPYGQNQIIQNLEGGIVESILIEEGQVVKAGQVILKISNAKSTSTSQTNSMKYNELFAKQLRLNAEANDKKFTYVPTEDTQLQESIRLAKMLYDSNRLEENAKDEAIVKQIEQRKQEYKEAQARINSLKRSLDFVSEEISMTAPMVQEGVKSKVDFLKLKREANGIENDIEASSLSLPRLQFAIDEYKSKRAESRQLFINKAKKELNEVTAEIQRLQTQQIELSDKVDRTMVRSPVDGIVQKLFLHTVGGVIKPGADLVEIVPTDKRLYLEIQIKPSDIAFIHPGAAAQVKISAYDFSIHGGLTGKVVNISPDTITDNEGDTYYIIHIETTKNHLGTKKHPLKIIPGMTASSDIVTGQKTVMQYLLKPILKSKQYVFSER